MELEKKKKTKTKYSDILFCFNLWNKKKIYFFNLKKKVEYNIFSYLIFYGKSQKCIWQHSIPVLISTPIGYRKYFFLSIHCFSKKSSTSKQLTVLLNFHDFLKTSSWWLLCFPDCRWCNCLTEDFVYNMLY